MRSGELCYCILHFKRRQYISSNPFYAPDYVDVYKTAHGAQPAQDALIVCMHF